MQTDRASLEEVRERFAQNCVMDCQWDWEALKSALYMAGPQWGDRSPEDILMAINAAGFMVVRRDRLSSPPEGWLDD